jgi:hypothetical protein
MPVYEMNTSHSKSIAAAFSLAQQRHADSGVDVDATRLFAQPRKFVTWVCSRRSA